MPSALPICLTFDSGVSQVTRSRMEYAFRVFAAIYNYRVVDSPEEGRDFRYGNTPAVFDSDSAVRIPARYIPRAKEQTIQRPSRVSYAGEDIYLFHGLDPISRQPDWLGEIFEWLSSGHENDILLRDSVGRIPDSAMIFASSGLPTWKPQAALLMAWMEQVFRNGVGKESLPKPPSPTPDAEHLVVCSHDIDFYFTNRADAFKRLIKNMGIAVLLYRNWGYFISNFKMAVKAIAGRRIGDYLPTLCERLDGYACCSTFFVVAAHNHRRDPDYTLTNLAVPIKMAKAKGFSVALHGSYTSVMGNHTLVAEGQALERVSGEKTLGSRQHWLRFDDHRHLFESVIEAGFHFDSSLGFTDTVGFRNGACFAFPPYDFQREKPYDFLEIPLAIMDGSLVELSRSTGEAAQVLAERILDESRNRGWGGIAILWHNPIEALSVPEEVNHVFWKCAESRQRLGEKWISTDQFFSLCLSRYQNAGLLTNLKPEQDQQVSA